MRHLDLKPSRTGRLPRLGSLLLGLLLLPGCLWDIEDPQNLAQLLLNGRFPLMFTAFSDTGSAGRDIEDLLTSLVLLPAKSTLRCSFEDVNSPGVLDALYSAHLRGVDIRVGIDEDNKWGIGYTALADYLQTAGGDDQRLFLGNAGRDKQVYMNVCVADDTRVWFSTAAPTVMDLYRETGYAIYFQSPDSGLARKFKDEMDLITHDAFGSAKQQRNRRNHWLIQNVDVGAYMAPADEPVEGFMVPRVIGAKDSIQLFSSSWFANELDASDVRETNDLAHEIKQSAAAYKEVMVTGYADQAPDPNAASSLNSMGFMRAQGGATRYLATGQWGGNGMNFLILDAAGKDQQVFVSSHPFDSTADSSHDGITLVFEEPEIVNRFSRFYDGLKAGAVKFPSGQIADVSSTGSRAVVISEILWAGGYSLELASRASEYFELYNTSASTLNISGWAFQCKTSGGFTAPNYTIPDRTYIRPGEYLLFSDTSEIVIDYYYSGTSISIASTTTQCRLIDGASNVVDLAGDGINQFGDNTDLTGYSDSTEFLRASMERTDLGAAGNDLGNWHTATTPFETNYNFDPEFAHRTFGTPGYSNSAAAATVAQADALINEVKVGTAPGPEDFIEIYVKTAGSMGGWKITSDSTTRYTFDANFSVQAGDIIVLHYDSANQGLFANEDDAGSTITESAGTDSGATAYDVYISTTTQSGTDATMILTNKLGQVVDTVPYSNMDGDASSSTMSFWATLDGDPTFYKWDFSATPVDGGNDALIQSEGIDVSNAAQSTQRDSNYAPGGGGIHDTNSNAEWCQSAHTMGLANVDCP